MAIQALPCQTTPGADHKCQECLRYEIFLTPWDVPRDLLDVL